MAEKVKNPFWRFVAVIKNDFRGRIVDIERGVASGVYLYRVRYEDGDYEHFTEQEIRDHLDPACTLEERKKQFSTLEASIFLWRMRIC